MYGMGTILLFGKMQSPRTCVRPLPDGAVLLQTVGELAPAASLPSRWGRGVRDAKRLAAFPRWESIL